MNAPIIKVEVRPGLILRMRRDEAERYGYKAVEPAQHKAVKPKAAKRKTTKPAEEETDGSGDDR